MARTSLKNIPTRVASAFLASARLAEEAVLEVLRPRRNEAEREKRRNPSGDGYFSPSLRHSSSTHLWVQSRRRSLSGRKLSHRAGGSIFERGSKQNKYLKEEFKILLSYLGGYRRDLTILSVFGLISALGNGAVPYIMGRFFDALSAPFTLSANATLDFRSPIFLLAVFVAVQIIVATTEWRANIRRGILREVIYGDYISRAYGTLLELPLSFHKDSKVGDIAQRFNRAANNLGDIVAQILLEIAPDLLSIIVGLAFAFYVNYVFAAILFTGVAVYLLVLFRIIRPIAAIYSAAQKIDSRASAEAHNILANVQVVKNAVTENYEQRRVFKFFRVLSVAAWSRGIAIWSFADFSRRFIVVLTQLAIFSVSLVWIHYGLMTIGELLMFNGYAAIFFGPFARVGNWWHHLQIGLVAIRRAEEILSLPREIYSPPNAAILSALEDGIVFKDVAFVYTKKENKVLDGASFEIKAGEKIALVGGSGEGKSTIVDLIAGFWFAQKGKVLIDGHNVKNLDLKFLRSQIAVVPQEVVLFNDTIKKNIAYGSFSATDEEITAAAREAYADEFIEAFPKKYDQIVGERGVKLSVGQKQRIAIARAILRDPKILILDEPTSALDAKSEKYITESLEKLMEGRTTIIIAHRLSTVRKADKILVLKGGKIAEQGKHDELIKIDNGIYRELYELQVGLHE